MQRRFASALSSVAFPDGRQTSFLLGVSGGVDSMTMLHLFMKAAPSSQLVVAHMNFSLRGEESDADEALVRDFCLHQGVRFISKKVDTLSVASSGGISLEMAARNLRYGWFNSLLEEMHLDYVAVAHNLNDSVETLFLNLLRGTGIKGITGIKPLSGRVFRPMLEFTRSEIEAFAKQNSIPFRVDSTNLQEDYARNKIRNGVFPRFESINPSFLSTVSASMKHFSDACQIIEEDMERFRSRVCRNEDGVVVIDAAALEEAGHSAFRLFSLLEGYGFNSSQALQAASFADAPGGAIFHSPTHTLVRDRGCLKIYPSVLPRVKGCKVRVFDIPERFDPKNAPQGVLYADADLLTMPLECRRWKNADSFRPLGMKNFKKVSDFFTDLKLDVRQKKHQTIVTTRDENGCEQIVCILGLRLDDRFRVSDATVRVAEIS